MTTIFLAIAALAAVVFLVLFLQSQALAKQRSEELREVRKSLAERDEEVRARTKTERDLSTKNREALERATQMEAQISQLREGADRLGASAADLTKANETLASLQKQIGAARSQLALLTESVDLTDIAFYAPTFREAVRNASLPITGRFSASGCGSASPGL
jgi:uncharacterized protein YoxC